MTCALFYTVKGNNIVYISRFYICNFQLVIIHFHAFKYLKLAQFICKSLHVIIRYACFHSHCIWCFHHTHWATVLWVSHLSPAFKTKINLHLWLTDWVFCPRVGPVWTRFRISQLTFLCTCQSLIMTTAFPLKCPSYLSSGHWLDEGC